MAEKSILDLAHELMNPVQEKPKKRGVVGTGNFKKKVHSNSLMVHPDQVQEAMKSDRKLGFATEYDANARPVFSDNQTLRKYCKARGLYHGGY